MCSRLDSVSGFEVFELSTRVGFWNLEVRFSKPHPLTRTFTFRTPDVIEFADACANAWGSPPSRSVIIPIGQTIVVDASYIVLPPILAFDPTSGITMTGATNTKDLNIG